jgi:3-oxoacyl-[acyl-carrier protein] reductase
MDLGIRGRVALVTGASSGIGEAIALALAGEGATVAVAARRLDRLESVAGDAKKRGATDARAFEVDFEKAGSVGKLLAQVQASMGAIQILVANSGGPMVGTFRDLDLNDWDTGYRTTLRSMLELVHGVLPPMTATGWGRIVALTSTSVKQPLPNLVLSNAFRTALVAALKTLSLEVARVGVTVNSIQVKRQSTRQPSPTCPSVASRRRRNLRRSWRSYVAIRRAT